MRNSGKVVAVLAVVIAMTLGQSLLMAAPTNGMQTAYTHTSSDNLLTRIANFFAGVWGAGVWGAGVWGGGVWTTEGAVWSDKK